MKGETMATVNEVAVYWNPDPRDEGWVYSVFYDDGREEGGPSAFPAGLDVDEATLQEAVVAISHQYGVAIDADSVSTDSPFGNNIFGVWNRTR